MILKNGKGISIFLGFFLIIFFNLYTHKMVVITPITNLRCHPQSCPQGLKAPALSQDIGGQISQLLMGEHVIVKGSARNGWVKVEVPGQKWYSQGAWRPIEGYLKKHHVKVIYTAFSCNAVIKRIWTKIFKENKRQSPIISSLPLGAKLQIIKAEAEWYKVKLANGQVGFIVKNDVRYLKDFNLNENSLRKSLVNTALQFKGHPYVWGGRSPFSNELQGCISGIDCSSLVHLIYDVHKLNIPKISHDQFLCSTPVRFGKDLKPGDLVFFFLGLNLKIFV